MSLVNTDGSVHPKVIYDGRSDRPANAKKAPDEAPESRSARRTPNGGRLGAGTQSCGRASSQEFHMPRECA
jgi:hypothetical protein